MLSAYAVLLLLPGGANCDIILESARINGGDTMETVKLKPFIANYIWGGHRLCPVYGLDGETVAAEA